MAKTKRRRTKKSTAGVVTIIMLAILVASRWLPRTSRSPGGSRSGKVIEFEKSFEATVLRVSDGDTIVVTGNQKVRLIGVDALETRNGKRLEGQAGRLGMHSSRAVKWGKKAKVFATNQLLDAEVDMRAGPERFDKYGRLLAYVWYKPSAEGKPICFNELLIREGYALATRRFKHPERDNYLALEAEAKRSKKGLWAYATK